MVQSDNATEPLVRQQGPGVGEVLGGHGLVKRGNSRVGKRHGRPARHGGYYEGFRKLLFLAWAGIAWLRLH